MRELGSKLKSRDPFWSLAVMYIIAIVMILGVPAWFGWEPKPTVQGVVMLSTFFVLLGIGGLLSSIEDLCERMGPPRQ